MIFIIILLETLYLMYTNKGKLKPMSIMYTYNQVAMSLSVFILMEILLFTHGVTWPVSPWALWVYIIGGVYLIINIWRLIKLLVVNAKRNYVSDIQQIGG